MVISKSTVKELKKLIGVWLKDGSRECSLLIDCANVLIDHRTESEANHADKNKAVSR